MAMNEMVSWTYSVGAEMCVDKGTYLSLQDKSSHLPPTDIVRTRRLKIAIVDAVEGEDKRSHERTPSLTDGTLQPSPIIDI